MNDIVPLASSNDTNGDQNNDSQGDTAGNLENDKLHEAQKDRPIGLTVHDNDQTGQPTDRKPTPLLHAAHTTITGSPHHYYRQPTPLLQPTDRKHPCM